MNPLASMLRMDFQLQWRYGFYYAAMVITLVWIALLNFIPEPFIEMAIIVAIFTDLAIVGFYFIAGQVIFEKTEKTLYALVVTPIEFKHYLTSKLASLSFLALIISVVVLLFTYGWHLNMALFILGVISMSLVSLLVGAIAIAPFRSISTFILPSQFYLMILGLPLLEYFGLLKSPLFYLLPTQGAVVFLIASFGSVETRELIFALLNQVLWIVILIWISGIMFERFIVAGNGGAK
ncbi:fluoroquinolone export ABC transporter permease subunit [Desulforamulus aquiferis]|uniref:ABC-2 type transporter domain-containing protein n=1 Tax=Desulforamulus aquiferis TaxID=1397668 RepID=A0AAW7Z9G8_9FIRM|nr:hypothetical protein [Desulforamulus aquiferis]MDO7785721.1 hypothetical protein [Desulforamulus aquiferis]RYD06947.1 hypothetical protein N752_01260 [Desulforamulus aquiferis]